MDSARYGIIPCHKQWRGHSGGLAILVYVTRLGAVSENLHGTNWLFGFLRIMWQFCHVVLWDKGTAKIINTVLKYYAGNQFLYSRG